MLLPSILEYSSSVTLLIPLMLALVINIYTGPLTLFSQHKLHPLNKLESILKWFDLKLNRKNRSPIERRVRGCLTVISILFLSGLFGIVGVWFSQKFPLASILDIILLLIIIDQKNTYTTAQKIKVALRDHNIESVLQSIRGLTAESIEKMDSFAIARTTIEMLTTLLITRLIAPTFFYVLFGLLGLAIYCALDMMNIKIGSRTPHYKDFGIVARHLNAVVLFFPSLLTGILIVIASFFLPIASPLKSLKNILLYSNKYYSTNLGVPLSAVAGSLNIALGGPRRYSTKSKKESWVGTGTAKVTHQDLHRWLHLYTILCLINNLLIVLLISFIYL